MTRIKVPLRAEQGSDPEICTEFKYTELVIRKPNFWLYLVGDLGYMSLCVLFGWLGFKYDSAVAFFFAGALSVFASNLDYQYHVRLSEYHRYLRERAHNE